MAQAPDIFVRTASERDYPAIARIQQACPEAAQWPVGDYSNFNVLLALGDGVPAGFCAWRTAAPGESELLNLGVEPAWRRRGVASALMNHLQAQIDGELFLEVAENNEAAIALYRRHGWDQVGTRPGYYAQGAVSAIVMKKCSW
ncbi:MAG: GNAT family N-acetyltransferase [Acidobacteriota bacterium]|nr:GNAT family N-acetyltransferase [Acidobacteriota bacterium]